MELTHALVGLTKKSIFYPSMEDAIISNVVQSMRGIDRTLPVIFNHRILGFVTGKQHSPQVLFQPVSPGLAMAGITSYDDIISACSNGRRYAAQWAKVATTTTIANNWYDLWPVAGNPAAGGYSGAAFTLVQFSDATAGSLYSFGNVEPTYNKFLSSNMGISSGQVSTIYVYDRVATYEACTFNASVNQGMTNGLAAQRYISAGQSGLKIMVTGQTVLGATAANLTQLQYTNQAGTALQSMPTTTTVSFIASAAAPTSNLGARVVCPATAGATLSWGPFLPLATGDSGARLIANYTTSAANTGTLAIILLKPLAVIGLGATGFPTIVDHLTQFPGVERVYDGACLSLLQYTPTTTAQQLYGEANFVWN